MAASAPFIRLTWVMPTTVNSTIRQRTTVKPSMMEPPVLRTPREGEWESCMKPPAATRRMSRAVPIDLI